MSSALLIWALTSQPGLEQVLPAGEAVSAPGSHTVIWECPDLVEIPGPAGTPAGYSAEGCGFSGPSGDLLLPEKCLFVPVTSRDPSVTVTAEGVGRLGSFEVMAASLLGSGSWFAPADPGDLPTTWGRLAGIHVFRGARLAEIRLDPVICSGGSLLGAGRLVVRIAEGPSVEAAGATRRPSGAEAELFRLLCGGEAARVRIRDRRAPADSPFWGLPWYRIGVDTAGVYAVGCEDMPAAEGALSTSMALFCGRGRMAGNYPWQYPYAPRPVPMLVEDGGDGTFDAGDRIVFFGRGLSWWEPDSSSMPSHFMSNAAFTNCYWLTWGVAGGARMPVLDAGLTGEGAMPQTTLARFHFEKDLVWKRGMTSTDWFWDGSYGTGVQTYYHMFDCPGSGSQGTLRMFFKSPDYGDHSVQIILNDAILCDTLWRNLDDFTLELEASNLRQTGNVLGYRIDHTAGGDAVYFDWLEVFCWSSLQTRGQTQVPLEWYGTGDRRFRIDWVGSLAGCRVFAVSGDTAAVELDISGQQSFEVELPPEWAGRELWVVPEASLMRPPSIEEAEPGRIVATLDGASTVYISASQFVSDVQPLVDASPGAELVDVQEIYDEFNGGVRDPQAIRTFLDYAMTTWSPAPLDVVLVGSGHYDPRNNISTSPSLIDALLWDGTETCTDDIYGILSSSYYPQIAISRIGARQRTDVQLVVQRTIEYSSGDQAGQWQTLVVGAADDERSSRYEADEPAHTESMERVLEEHLIPVLRPIKHYEIFYPFGEGWRKPEARQDLIDLWCEGALVILYLGHGGFDQLADEGLLYIEDLGLLACGQRMPLAFFGSCSVGDFFHPGRDCIAQNITTSPAGGAIQAIGATWETSGGLNETLMEQFLDDLFSTDQISTSSCLLAAKLTLGYSENDRKYVLFGDGSVRIALPPDQVDLSTTQLRTGEQAQGTGTAPAEGLVLLQGFESSQADTYYTFRQNLPIPYRTQGGLFYSGSCAAGPALEFGMFVPVDADTGNFARISAFFLGGGSSSAGAVYPASLIPGSPSSSDTIGPEIELWLDGFRSTPEPVASGPVTVCAELHDTSGIDLLGGPGRQLALYVDGDPQDISRFFRYDPGSSSSGSLEVGIGSLPEGAHSLELRASDCLLNRSSMGLDFVVTAGSGLALWQVFVYPCPSGGDGLSLNWMQSADGYAEVDIYTVAGRRIAAFRNIPAEAGYNSLWWNCADSDGDPVASGSYVYRLGAASGTASAEATGIIAIVR